MDFNSSVRVVRFNEGDSESSTCITLSDDQLREGDEVFSVLLIVPNISTVEPGPQVLATITILGMCLCLSVCENQCAHVCACAYVNMYYVYMSYIVRLTIFILTT